MLWVVAMAGSADFRLYVSTGSGVSSDNTSLIVGGTISALQILAEGRQALYAYSEGDRLSIPDGRCPLHCFPVRICILDGGCVQDFLEVWGPGTALNALIAAAAGSAAGGVGLLAVSVLWALNHGLSECCVGFYTMCVSSSHGPTGLIPCISEGGF